MQLSNAGEVVLVVIDGATTTRTASRITVFLAQLSATGRCCCHAAVLEVIFAVPVDYCYVPLVGAN